MLNSPSHRLDPAPSPAARKRSRGFTTLEMVMVVAVGVVMTAIAVPLVQSSLRTFRLGGSVSAVTGAIESTRYRAIFDGCPYRLSFNNATNTYQVSNTVTGGACAAAYANVGAPVPFGNPGQVALNQNLTFQFSPGGSVQTIAGAPTFTLSNVGTPNLKTITVTKYGSITVQ